MRRISCSAAILIYFLAAIAAMGQTKVIAAPPKLKILVPAYFYPAGDGLKNWDALITSSSKAPIVAIVNPASGPGKKADPNYTAVVQKATVSSLTLIGYVSTSYGKRAAAQVNADVDHWLKLYPGLQGFFFDEQASDAKHVSYYTGIADHARKALPKAMLVANPGTLCDESYFKKGTADAWCVFEDGKPPSAYTPPAWAGNYPASRFNLLSYAQKDASAIPAAVQTAVDKRIGLIFITDDTLPNPWDTLPPYWDSLVTTVGNINKSP